MMLNEPSPQLLISGVRKYHLDARNDERLAERDGNGEIER